MARRKRRSTQRSRSQSTAARRRLTLGDIVRVKDGVMDPDYDGYCIGGWSGEIIACETWEQTPMALIAWDASTHRARIDLEVRRRAASQGLSAAQMWLHLREFERVDGVKGASRSEAQSRDQGVEPSAASWTPPSWGHRYPDVLRLRDEGAHAGDGIGRRPSGGGPMSPGLCASLFDRWESGVGHGHPHALWPVGAATAVPGHRPNSPSRAGCRCRSCSTRRSSRRCGARRRVVFGTLEAA